MTLIAFGRIDKKFVLVPILLVADLINLIISKKADENNKQPNKILSVIESDISPIIFGIILYFIFKSKRSKENKAHKSFKYIIYLFLLLLARRCYDSIFDFMDSKYKVSNLYFTDNGIKLILVTIGTSCLLKYNYYIHHSITLIINSILGIVSDCIIQNYSQIDFSYVYIYIIYLIVYIVTICYTKYMMDKLYYQYTELMIYYGIITVIIDICFFSALSIYENKNNINNSDKEENDYKDIFGKIYNYFHNTNPAIIIFYQILYFLLYGGIELLMEILIIYYLKPNHILLPINIYLFLNALFHKEDYRVLYILIPLCFQIFMMLLYFEILELNFCGLNKNTVKNIEYRGRAEDDIYRKQSFESSLELSEQYYIENCELMNNDEDEN